MLTATPRLGIPCSPGVSRLRNARGFSLIEVVIAIGIFTFAIIPIIALLSSGMGTLKDSMSETVRTDIARRVVGEYQRMPYSNLVASTSFFDSEGWRMPSSNADTIFLAISTLSNPPSLISTDTNTARLLTVTIRHVRDTNSKTRYSQMLINTAQ